MFRAASNVTWARAGGRVFPRYQLMIGRQPWPSVVGRREWDALATRQEEAPVALCRDGERRYWWYRGRFYWDDDLLDAADVLALVAEREDRQERRLQRAHALLAADVDAAAPRREGISRAVKQAVWERCSGACAECGGTAVLEFDHIIPVAMGGSSSERNLQLLCADCNRAKGASL